MKVNNNMHNTREVSRTPNSKHTQEREAPPTPKHGLPPAGKRLKALPLRLSGGRGDGRVHSVATSTMYVYTFLTYIK